MLLHIDVLNYTLVDSLSLDFKEGLTTLTGETGAGKSLLLDALGFALGHKVRSEAIFDESKPAEVAAVFDISTNERLQKHLNSLNIEFDDECLLRRVITTQGRSRCYINGQSITAAQLQDISRHLAHIHGQHEHQQLHSNKAQLQSLDRFAGHAKLLEATQSAFTQFDEIKKALASAKQFADESSAERQLLQYQFDELRDLNIQQGEVEQLETQQRQLLNAQTIDSLHQQLQSVLSEDDNAVTSSLGHAIHTLTELSRYSATAKEQLPLLETALINVQEVASSLEHMQGNSDFDDDSPEQIEARLTLIYNAARKHKIKPHELWQLANELEEKLAAIGNSDEEIQSLERELKVAEATYFDAAAKLTKARNKAAKTLAGAITKQLSLLSMAHAKVEIDISSASPSRHGSDCVEFLISTIPGKPAAPIGKIASGGELSRIGLAIQVVTAESSVTPTMIFDEVDSGIGGATGDVVGRLLRQLGERTQVLCVTHLAQVASKANHHLYVEKRVKSGSLKSNIHYLSGEKLTEEIARMIGGDNAAATSLAHAQSMLEGAEAH